MTHGGAIIYEVDVLTQKTEIEFYIESILRASFNILSFL